LNLAGDNAAVRLRAAALRKRRRHLNQTNQNSE
jgi:hypothetical protein